MTDTKRRAARFPINHVVLVRLSNGQTVKTVGKDISASGVFVESQAGADVGDEFDLKINLSFGGHLFEVIVRAKVARVITRRDSFGVGFSFVRFYADSEAALKKYIKIRSL